MLTIRDKSKKLNEIDKYFLNGEYEKALIHYKKYFSTIPKRGKKYLTSLLLYKLGSCYYEIDKFYEAIDSLKKANSKIGRSKNGKYKKLKFDICRLIGLVYYTKGQYNEAVKYALMSKDVILSSDNINEIDLSEVYNDIANYYNSFNDYEKAVEFVSKAISLIHKKPLKGYSSLGLYYNNLGVTINNAYRKYDNSKFCSFPKSYILTCFKKALNYLNKYPPQTVKLHIANLYNNISFYYLLISKPTKEKYYLLKSLKHFQTLPGNNGYYISILYLNLGSFYFRQSNFSKALYYYNKSLSIRKKILGEKSTILVKNFLYMGDCYVSIGKFIEGLRSYQKALNILARGKKVNGYIMTPNVENITFIPELIDVLFNKAETLKKIYFQNKKLKYLKASFECSKILSALFDNIRINLTNPESKAILSSKIILVYESCIDISKLLYDLSGDDLYIQYAFKFSEKSKATSLLEEITEQDAKHLSNIPDDLIEKEAELKAEIGYYQKKLFNEDKKHTKNVKRKSSDTESKLFHSKQKLELLIQKFEKEYEEYYDLKYNYNTVSLTDIQSNLKNDETILEYFLGEKYIFIFKITGKAYELIKVKKSNSFNAKLKKFRKCLTLDNVNSPVNTFKDFAELSHYFFKILLKDVFKEDIPSKLTIIPDGFLNYIPFEVLLTNKPGIGASYKNVSYLLEKCDIRYNYSSTLLLRTTGRNHQIKELAVLGFAPSFKQTDNVNKKEDILRSGLTYLKWNIKELQNTRKYFRTSVYQNRKARKKKFIEKAKHYPIIHLATHGIVEDQNPMFSKIAFTPVNSSVDDGYLHAYELYNMNLNSELTILSACDTGFGKLVKGEGVMSLARGFLFAGSGSVMMSLWQVSDFATCKIVDSFYKGLSEGLNKDKALRQAKLNYIKKSDSIKSNPSYWAPFVLIGSNAPLR